MSLTYVSFLQIIKVFHTKTSKYTARERLNLCKCTYTLAIDALRLFSDKNAAAFDPHVGDHGCQGRAIIYAIWMKTDKQKRVLGDDFQQLETKWKSFPCNTNTTKEEFESHLSGIMIHPDSLFIIYSYYLTKYRHWIGFNKDLFEITRIDVSQVKSDFLPSASNTVINYLTYQWQTDVATATVQYLVMYNDMYLSLHTRYKHWKQKLLPENIKTKVLKNRYRRPSVSSFESCEMCVSLAKVFKIPLRLHRYAFDVSNTTPPCIDITPWHSENNEADHNCPVSIALQAVTQQGDDSTFEWENIKQHVESVSSYGIFLLYAGATHPDFPGQTSVPSETCQHRHSFIEKARLDILRVSHVRIISSPCLS
jgi:hypothetical protein